ncbi:MAG: FG-GAP repeat domain-containing protein [Saprospiraceae bacterium]
MYFYNGAGVGVGDFDGDGLLDLYFSGNQVEDAVYLNRGDFKFDDVTTSTGIHTDSLWSTGVSVVDINADGKLDVYVSVVSPLSTAPRSHSRLYINESTLGNIRFSEQSQQYGLAIKGYGTQALFFDATADGLLETYLLRHSVHSNGTFGARGRLIKKRDSLAGDLLLQLDKGAYKDESEAFSITSSALGYGLGIVSGDFNSDGYLDVYIANDFHEDDYLYLNGKGTHFKESLRESISHTSRFSMGVDASDLNQDGFLDIVSLDMLPFQHDILKASAGEDPFDVWKLKLRNGYWPQYSRNMLQMSKGLHPDLSGNPIFSDIGMLSGISATDWSWSVLLKDFDLDGDSDAFITNGIYGRSNDMDYINFISNPKNQARIKSNRITTEDLALADQMPEVKLKNQLFLNNGDGVFQAPALLGAAGFSHGSVSADLDNDGDLDLVISDVNGAAQLLENRSISKGSGPMWVGIELVQQGGNRSAIGGKITFVDGVGLSKEIQAIRGFLSSSDTRVVFPVDRLSFPMKIQVNWSDRTMTEHDIDSSAINKYNTIVQNESDAVLSVDQFVATPPFRTIPAENFGITFSHKENNFNEFNRQALILEMTSEEGPALAIADVTGDGLDDLFFGGAKGQAAELWSQKADGLFSKEVLSCFEEDQIFEDVDALFLDYDSDGDQDLLVLSGGSEYPTNHINHCLRLYENNEAVFNRVEDKLLAETRIVGSRLVVLDSSDEPLVAVLPRTQTDLAAVATPGFVLKVNANHEFIDVTNQVAPWFNKLNMITDAIKVSTLVGEYLILARDWGPVTAHRIVNAKIEEDGLTLASNGFWRSLTPKYKTNGKLEKIVLGNLGLNSKLQPSLDEPMKMYVSDFDQNGSVEHIVTVNSGGEERIFATRDEVTKQLVAVRKNFKSYTDFARADFNDLVPSAWQKKANKFTVTQAHSGQVFCDSDGFKSFQAFPIGAQESTVQAGANLAGKTILAGNTSAVTIQRGAYDASFGLLLERPNTGCQEIIDNRPSSTGVYLPGITRSLKQCVVAGDTMIVAARNNNTPLIIAKN